MSEGTFNSFSNLRRNETLKGIGLENCAQTTNEMKITIGKLENVYC